MFYLPHQIDQVVVQEYHGYVKVDTDLKPSEKQVTTQNKRLRSIDYTQINAILEKTCQVTDFTYEIIFFILSKKSI
jgi:hypothetical protein